MFLIIEDIRLDNWVWLRGTRSITTCWTPELLILLYLIENFLLYLIENFLLYLTISYCLDNLCLDNFLLS